MTEKLHATKKNAEGIMLKTENGRTEKRKNGRKKLDFPHAHRHVSKKAKKVFPATESGTRTQALNRNGDLRTATRISYALSRKLEKKGKHLSRCAEEKAES